MAAMLWKAPSSPRAASCAGRRLSGLPSAPGRLSGEAAGLRGVHEGHAVVGPGDPHAGLTWTILSDLTLCPSRPRTGNKLGTTLALQTQCSYNANE